MYSTDAFNNTTAPLGFAEAAPGSKHPCDPPYGNWGLRRAACGGLDPFGQRPWMRRNACPCNSLRADIKPCGAVVLESDRGIGIGVDAAGNSVVTGYYQSTATFDPFMLTSAGGQDIFVAEYNTCGSGSVDPGEECDGGFGCTNCSCDADFEPTAPPSLECQPICGSGSVDPGEECDGGLGCTDCLCDADFEPMTPPSLDCQPTCGNDNVDPGEQCDGMDDAACPGACLSDCTCGPFCGDGVCDPGEDSCNCPDDCGPPDESETPGSTCSDGLDNDCDGDADCRDPDCDEDPDCEGVPTVSQWGMTVLLVALLAGIALKFRRSRTT